MAQHFRVDRLHGKYILCGGIVPVSFLKRGQRWMSSSGNEVEIDKIIDGWVTYTWKTSNSTTESHEKLSFSFQCRYCLILDTPQVPKELTSTNQLDNKE